MATETNQVVAQNSNASGVAPGNTPTATPVAARKGFRVALQQLLQGFQTVIPGGSSVMTSNGSLTQADVVARLQGYLVAYSALDAQTTAYKQARQPVVAQQSDAKQFYALLKMALDNQFGARSPMLEQFGIKPKKAPRALTASQLAVRAAKLVATRKLRGTMGSSKKASIKAGPMKFIDPVTDPAAASTAQPEPAVGAAGSPTAK